MKKKWFFILKVSITVISLIGAILAKSDIDWSNINNNYINPMLVKEIVYDFAVGVFSAMILVWFIDEINEHLQERQTKNSERDAIRRFDRVLQQYIARYEIIFFCVATPIDDRKTSTIKMPKNFLLKDMRDLHQTPLLLIYGFADSSISAFLQIEYDLRQRLISLTDNNDFNFYPQFYEIFSQYIEVSLNHDCRTAILDIQKRSKRDESLTNCIKDILENGADEYYQKIKSGQPPESNIIYPYVLLYEMMNLERDLIMQYQEEIKKLT